MHEQLPKPYQEFNYYFNISEEHKKATAQAIVVAHSNLNTCQFPDKTIQEVLNDSGPSGVEVTLSPDEPEDNVVQLTRGGTRIKLNPGMYDELRRIETTLPISQVLNMFEYWLEDLDHPLNSFQE